MKSCVAVLLALCSVSQAARILTIFPTPSISHQLPMQAVMKALAARGHQVTVISPDPLKEAVANYTDIDLSFTYTALRNAIDISALYNLSPTNLVRILSRVGEVVCESQLSSEPIQDFIRSIDQKYDLVIMERAMFQCYYGLYHLVGSPPIIGMLSFGAPLGTLYSLGNPSNPAYIPDMTVPYSDHMTFWERLYNTFLLLKMRYDWNTILAPKQEEILRKYFGDAPPPVTEGDRNFSLLLVGNDWTLGYPKPLLPNIIELTGLHIKTTPSPMSKDIKRFMDGAKDGVIYFSLGSNVMSNTIPEEKRQAILNVFSKLPQRVLWKWESDSLPGQPSNVMVGKWLPQQAILAHPNIRLFITQGGMQSFQEASYYGVPLLGIPFITDQKHHLRKCIASGIGVQLELKDLNEDTFLGKIEIVLKDSSYADNMRRFSTVFKEQAHSSLSRAVWWTEYVIRHHGAKHLRSAVPDLTWYQYLLLDVIAFMAVVFITVVSITFVVLRKLYRFVCQCVFKTKLKTA